MKSKNILNISLLMLCTFFSVFATAKGMEEFTKTLEERFNVRNDVTFDIESKYGDVHINTWDKNEVFVEVEITVKAKNEDEAEDIFNRIDINFDDDPSEIRVETVYRSEEKKGWGGWTNNSCECSYTVDYEVYMPVDGSVDVELKYGNLNLDEINGEAAIELKYGNIWAKNINNDVELMLGYGDAEFDNVHDMEMEVKYSRIEIESSKHIELDSKYSNYKIGAVETIDIYSCKYDKYDIKEINEIEGEHSYTTFIIEKLNSSLEMDSRYGNIKVFEIHPNFQTIDIDGSYTPIKINMDREHQYEVEVEIDYGHVDFWDSDNIEYIEESTSEYLKGVYGSGQNPGFIQVSSRYGNVSLR